MGIFLFVLLSDCDRYSGRRPYDYPPAKWVSEDPKIWFEIGKSSHSPHAPREKIYGCLVLNGQNIEIEVFFDYGNGVYFREKSNDDPVTRGECAFHSDKLVVKIDKERDNFLNELCETITFIRVPEWVFRVVSEVDNRTGLELPE